MYTAMELAKFSPSEADFLRKTVAKKKEQELLKQRDHFVNGAVDNGVSEEIANHIFDQWEAFARYGFPKGHAADYGVIAVQTAYLKTHYPVEYMTALLAVEQNNTDKVALYVADCRRMGIEVLPPDINRSGWDFTIEDHSDGISSIRFGLGAVKNVGHGPVDIILEGREEGSFNSLNDFVRRVDLRKVGKRALECLIKVGALTAFGPRTALLDVLERIVSISSSHFKAADTGQMSFFNPKMGLVEKIVLPSTRMHVTRREQLNWERDLIGLYVSDHPLNPVMEVIRENITHTASELSEAEEGQMVRVAGLITRIRPHTTKRGDAMAFATIEDFQGEIDLVIFPRTFAKYQQIIQWDNIVLVDGKVDNRGAEPKVLVDQIFMEFDKVVPLSKSPSKPSAQPKPISKQSELKPTHSKPVTEVNQPDKFDTNADNDLLAGSAPDWENGSVPPPPEKFPEGWDEANGFDQQSMNSGIEPDQENMLSEDVSLADENDGENEILLIDEPDHSDAEGKELNLEETHPTPFGQVTLADEVNGEDQTPALKPAEITEKVLKPILPPLRPGGAEDIQMITVILRPREDKTRDKLLLRRIFGLLICQPGEDRFAFQIFEHGKGHLLEFPNLTTGICPELLSQITDLVGGDNIRIEPITFQ